MKLGVVVPVGGGGDYDGWEAGAAWATIAAIAADAEAEGAESVWLTDHFTQTVAVPRDEATFESFTTLTALAALTRRVRLGHIVFCTGFRNPALTAKMISTMDVISGGRMELGIGAGWKEDEWRAYGYDFPSAPDRLAMLSEHLEIIERMLRPGRDAHATFEGRWASVRDAINLPKPLQAHVPIMVGGNGPKVTWRIAARHADELNLDDLEPEEVNQALPTIRSRCDEIGRDPGSLAVSVGLWWPATMARRERVERLSAYRELGLARVMVIAHPGPGYVANLVADARDAGLELEALPAG